MTVIPSLNAPLLIASVGDNSLLSAVITYKYDIKDTNGIWKYVSSPIKLLSYPWKDASYNVELHRVTVKMYVEMKIELKRQTYFFSIHGLGNKIDLNSNCYY